MIPVGAGPVPHDAADLRARVARSVAEALSFSPQHVAVDAEMSAVEVVDRLALDLSGCVIDARYLSPSVQPWNAPASTGGSSTTVRVLRLVARPLVFFGAPVTAEAEAVNVPAAWTADAADRLWLAFRDDASPLGPTAGRVLVEGGVQGVAAGVVVAATEVARQKGVGLRDVRVTTSSAGRNHVRVDLDATVTKSFFKSPVRAFAEIEIDADLVLHVRGLDASVSGFAGSIAKPMIDRYLTPWRNRSVPLREQTFAGAHLTSLALDVDPGGLFRLAATVG